MTSIVDGQEFAETVCAAHDELVLDDEMPEVYAENACSVETPSPLDHTATGCGVVTINSERAFSSLLLLLAVFSLRRRRPGDA
jgi:hypothetical protein